MTVADEDEVRFDAKRRIQFGEALAEHPVGGDATVVQEAGCRQQEGAGANRSQASDTRCHGSEPLDQSRIRARGLNVHPACDDQSVKSPRDIRAAVGGHNLKATVGRYGPGDAAITRTS